MVRRTPPAEGPATGPALRRATRYLTACVDVNAPLPGLRVRTHSVGDVIVLSVTGELDNVAADLVRAVGLALAEGPRAVVCDLSGVSDSSRAALAVLASAGERVRPWPGVPVVVASPAAQVRDGLGALPGGDQLWVTEAVRPALSAILRAAAPVVVSQSMRPHPTSPRAARRLVSEMLADRGLKRWEAPACLVASELVTNAMVHAGSEITVTIAVHGDRVRVCVRDRSLEPVQTRGQGLETHGRGLAIVAALAREWGVLPAADGGKVVWAVLGDYLHRSAVEPGAAALV